MVLKHLRDRNEVSSMRKRRILIVAGTGLVFPLLGAGLAAASFMPGGVGNLGNVSSWYDLVLNSQGGNPLERILGQLGEGDAVMDTIMDVALGQQWEDLIAASGSDPPNPHQVRTSDETPGSGVLTTNPVVRQRDVANLYDQELSRSLAAPMLGEAGETQVKEEGERITSIIETNQQGLETTQQLAQSAQSMTVTQDVMKNQTQMNSVLAGIVTNTAQLTADNRVALLELQRLDSIIAQISANTSEGIDESNRRERVERKTLTIRASQAPVYIPGLLGTSDEASEESED
jgi:hypothetical protein